MGVCFSCLCSEYRGGGCHTMGNASPGVAREDTASGQIRKVRTVPLCGILSWNPAHRLAVISWHSPFTYFGFPTMPFHFKRLLMLKWVNTSKQKILLVIWLERDSHWLSHRYYFPIWGYGVLTTPRWADRKDYSLDLPQISLFILY